MEALFSCVFCSRPFSRHDALKRHWTTCRLRQSRALDVPRVELKPRGRKLKACDRCSRLKQACNARDPCSACARHHQTCTYRRAHQSDAKTSKLKCIQPRGDRQYETVEFTENPSNSIPGLGGPDDDDWSLLNEQAFNASREGVSLPVRREKPLWSADWSQALALTQQLRPSERYLRPTWLDVTTLKQFTFLRRVANDVGIANTFECGTLQERKRAAQTWQTRITRSTLATSPASWQDDWNVLEIGTTSSGLGLSAEPDTAFMGNLSANMMYNPSESLWLPSERLVSQPNELVSSSSLAMSCLNEESGHYISKSQDIIAMLRDTILSRRHRPDIISMSWTASLEAMCHEFFRPEQLQTFLDLFWAFWKPNWPAIHRATFDPASSSPKLLAAMALLGASLSPDDRDRAVAHLWFNVVEELVFDDEVFGQDSAMHWDNSINNNNSNTDSLRLRRSHLEALQAAYCVVLYQTWEGSKESKRRIRRARYSAIVSLARDIGFSSATLNIVDTSSITRFNWGEFILRESLIRVFHYIFALDSGYALFNRHPPRIVLSELTIDLASPKSCFESQSAEECFVALKVWRDGFGASRFTTVASALAAICTGDYSPEISKLFERMSVLNMFTIVSGLFAMSFRLETSVIYSEEVSRIQAGLERWRELWPSPERDEELASMQTFFDHGEPAVGFMRYAPEYWLFTRLTLERIRNMKETEKANVVKCEDSDMGQLHTLLRSFSV